MDKEQITFDGIPIPLTMETIVNAMLKAESDRIIVPYPQSSRRLRQRTAFRDRILLLCENGEDLDRVVKEKWEAIEQIESMEVFIDGLHYEMEKALKEKDARIAELEAQIEDIAADAKWIIG